MAELNLPNIREGGNIRFRIGLEDGGVAVDWSGLEDIRVFLYADAQKQVSGEMCEVAVDEEDNTVLKCKYSGDDVQYRGINSVLVRAKYLGEIKVYDKPAINIVARTSEATGVVEIDDPVVPVQISVEDVSTSLLNNAIDAAINAAAEAEKAAHLVPLQVLEDCVEATGKALEAASKAPYIDETTGNWFVWDAEAGEYVDSGKTARGATGNGIASWSVVESSEDAGNNVVTVTFTDGTSESFNVKNGHTGNGIASIVQTVESPDDAGTNVITITMTNGTVVTFNVKNGSKGTPGVAQAAYKSVSSLPTASAQTMDKIYLTPSGTSGVYNMSYTEFDGSAYSWQDLGTTAIQLSDYATKAELDQLEAEVTDLEGPIERVSDLRIIEEDKFAIIDSEENVGFEVDGGIVDALGFGENLEGIIDDKIDSGIGESKAYTDETIDKQNNSFRDTEEDGFFIADPYGNVGARLVGKKFDVADLGDNIKGLIQQMNGKSLSVKMQNNNVELVSDLSDKYKIKSLITWMNTGNYSDNPVMNFGGSYLVNKQTSAETLINSEGDNICPIVFSNYSNLGANHGLELAKKVGCDVSQLDYSIIGKQMTSNGQTMYVVRLLNDGIVVLPSYSGKVFNSITIQTGDTLTYDTSYTIQVTSVGNYTIFPVCVSRGKELFLDGKNVTSPGNYVADFVRFVDTYDIFDPISYLDEIVENAGSWSANPVIDSMTIDFLVRKVISYQFTKGGYCKVNDDTLILNDTNISRLYGLNIKQMDITGVDGELKYYLPKSVPVSYNKNTGRRASPGDSPTDIVTYDFRQPSNQSSLPIHGKGDYGIWFTENDCEDGNAIERGVQFLVFENGCIAFNHGLFYEQPVGGINRLLYTPTPWRLRTQESGFWTAYPQSYDSTSEDFDGTLLSGDAFGVCYFRKYEDVYNNVPVSFTNVVKIDGNDDALFIYADMPGTGIYNIDIPEKYVGRKIEILYKRDNVSVADMYAQNVLTLKVSESDTDTNYGYCCIKIK